MTDFDLRLEISGDPESGDYLAAYLSLRRGDSVRTEEFIEGQVFADYDADDRLLGVEFLDFCDMDSLQGLLKDQPAVVKQFLNYALPRQLAHV